MKDEEGNEKRPDCIIDLPDDKNLIIDSKVSLNAYEQYINADDDLQKKMLIKHIWKVLKNTSKIWQEKTTQIFIVLIHPIMF